MKTIEEKAKAYDEALEKAKAHINSKGIGDTVDLCKHLFSELSESEDERIRKAIKLVLIATENDQKDFYSTHGLTRKDCTDWLEKQKKIIDSITASRITIRPDGGIERPTIAYLEKQKEQKQEWSEEDKKLIDDVINSLCCYQNTLSDYQKEIVGEEIRKLKSLRSVKREWSEEDERIRKQLINICNEWLSGGQSARPCLNDVKWLKNLLEKQEQKPAEWSEEDIESFVKSYSDSLPMCGEFQSYHDALVHAYRQGVVNTLKSLRPQPKKSGIVLTEEQEKEFGHLFTHPSWKPTQEQIELLEKLSNHGGHYGYQNLELQKLVMQLKKLRYGNT